MGKGTGGLRAATHKNYASVVYYLLHESLKYRIAFLIQICSNSKCEKTQSRVGNFRFVLFSQT